MAKANLSVLMEGLRGKAGNVVFVESREGTLVKPRVSPTNPNAKDQAAVRIALTKAAQAWTTLTAAQVLLGTTTPNRSLTLIRNQQDHTVYRL